MSQPSKVLRQFVVSPLPAAPGQTSAHRCPSLGVVLVMGLVMGAIALKPIIWPAPVPVANDAGDYRQSLKALIGASNQSLHAIEQIPPRQSQKPKHP